MQNGDPLHNLAGTGAGKINHVVYIVQENRSFDNLFQGYPGADTVSQRQKLQWQTIRCSRSADTISTYIDHSAEAMFAACNGTGRPARHAMPDERLR